MTSFHNSATSNWTDKFINDCKGCNLGNIGMSSLATEDSTLPVVDMTSLVILVTSSTFNIVVFKSVASVFDLKSSVVCITSSSMT